MTLTPDRIVKTTVLPAPLDRVWRAISDSSEFGRWFGAEFDGPFVAGTRLGGRIRPTAVDAEVAALQAPHDGTAFVVLVEAVEPLRRLAFRWHPHGVDDADPAAPTTLVEFELAAAPGGTALTITESGFDQVPPASRAAAFHANEGGWTHQLRLIAKYLAASPAA